MSKISRTLANEIALKLVDKLDIKLKNVDIQIKDILYKVAVSKVPKEIMNIFNGPNSEWIRCTTSSYFSWGSNHEYYSGFSEFPITVNKSVVVEDEALSDQLDRLKLERASLTKQRKELLAEIEETIIALGTPTRIREHFPEAAALLPEPRMEIAINVQSTIDKLKML